MSIISRNQAEFPSSQVSRQETVLLQYVTTDDLLVLRRLVCDRLSWYLVAASTLKWKLQPGWLWDYLHHSFPTAILQKLHRFFISGTIILSFRFVFSLRPTTFLCEPGPFRLTCSPTITLLFLLSCPFCAISLSSASSWWQAYCWFISRRVVSTPIALAVPVGLSVPNSTVVVRGQITSPGPLVNVRRVKLTWTASSRKAITQRGWISVRL